MKRLRTAILENKVNDFVEKFIYEQFINEKDYPRWIYDALNQAGIDTQFMDMDMKDL